MSEAVSSTSISHLRHKTPPGPRGDWLLGMARDFQRDLLGTMLAVHQQYGDVVRYRFALWHGYMVNNPDGVKRMLRTTTNRPPFVYFPFGGGPRLCIGKQFALTEAPLILATVAQRFALRLVPGHPVALEPLITLRPRHGLAMTLHPRSG